MKARNATIVLGEPRSWEPAYRFARFLRACIAPLLLAVFRVRVVDGERIPASGGAILAGNHVSYADAALLWCASARPVHFMAKSELMDIAFLGWALPRLWAFPVRRGEADRAAISTATAYLKAGDLVGMFPEGTRHRGSEELGAAHEGVSFVALRADVPIVPIGIGGTDKIKPEGSRMIRFPRVTLCIGEPVRPEDFAHLDKRERLSAMTAEVMRRISDELERARKA